MATRIEITSMVPDPRATALLKRLTNDGFRLITIDIVDVYTINATTPPGIIKRIIPLLIHPLTQKATVIKHIAPEKSTNTIEIGFLPGVTDNVGNTAKEMIADFLHKDYYNSPDVYSSKKYILKGSLSAGVIKQISGSLYNPLIQSAYIQLKTFPPIPKVRLATTAQVDEVPLMVSDDELVNIGKLGIADADGSRRGPLALDLTSMKSIQRYFKQIGRNPTDVELESIAQTWSEHCKHTIFADPIDDLPKGLFRTYIKAATDKIRKQKGKQDICVSVFTDNSGAILFNDTLLVSHKVETHNSPSALDPFGGAITGIVGVNRDAIGFGLGAKPIINVYGFCLASPSNTSILYRDKKQTQPMLSARRILDGVVAGVNAGGNCSGIPTPQGFVYFDDRYRGKPLVFAGTVGLIPKKINGNEMYKKCARPGDFIVMVGGRVGQDGIHGATFSSEALNSGSPATAVQIGDPITQKKLSDAIIKEARDCGLYHSITDNGAGGLSCSVAEMAKESGGCLVCLEKIPLKYPGLTPWQIWISESQERMTLAIAKNKWPEFSRLMKRRGVEATIIGKFTNSGKCVVQYHGKTVMDIDMEFLHDGLPMRHLTTKNPPHASWTDTSKNILTALSDPIFAGYSFISQQYDHQVQGTSVLKPLQGRGRINADATITRPVLNQSKGVVLSQALYPQYSDYDAYHMAASSIDTAIRNAVSAGASIDHLALLDNFCWCNAHDPMRLGQLKRAARACYDSAVAFGTPFISGKDSMFNDFKGFDEQGKPITISIPPTLLISAIGVIPDVTKSISLDVKFAGDLVYILGKTYKNPFTPINVQENAKLYRAFYKLATRGLVASAISVHHGGLGIALARTAMGGLLGLDIHLNSRDMLWNESQGRIVVTVAPKNKKLFEAGLQNISYECIGLVTNTNTLTIKGNNDSILEQCKLDELINEYRKPFKNY
jgi:phosphoribosylformylglycinamidine synthase subunit PurSL